MAGGYWNKCRIILAVVFIITGSTNIGFLRFMSMMKSENSVGRKTEFQHPLLQSLIVFLAEASCFIIYKIAVCIFKYKNEENLEDHKMIQGNREFNQFFIVYPAVADVIASSLILFGLTVTYPGRLQILRGLVVVFAALGSVIFLEKTFDWIECMGIFLMITGSTISGAAIFFHDSKYPDTRDERQILIGDLMIVFGQANQAIQAISEEKYIKKMDVAVLHFAGWEGMFGTVILGILLVPCYFVQFPSSSYSNPRGVVEDLYDAYIQMSNNYIIIIIAGCSLVSIGIYNFSGLSLTKEISCVTRLIVDSIRTFAVWFFFFRPVHQELFLTQLLGLILSLYGVLLYSGVPLSRPFEWCCKKCATIFEDESSTSIQPRFENLPIPNTRLLVSTDRHFL